MSVYGKQPGKTSESYTMVCPTGGQETDCVMLAHGEGGRLMRKFLRERIAPCLGEPSLEDAAALSLESTQLAVTTDSFVVSPLFFPGGDIGSLAVYGTVNDLAVAGAEPMCITLGMILEEGLPFDVLDRVLQSIASAAQVCGVSVVAGDTKVVPRGAADQLFINTTGIGRFRTGARLSCASLQVGDCLLVSGPIAHHGIAVMAAREGLTLRPAPRSDCGDLHEACRALQCALGDNLRAMRDATRGGVSAVLHEWADASQMTMQIEAERIPVANEIRGVCELLGLDPLHVANEGTFVAAVSSNAVEQALSALRNVPISRAAQVIGRVTQPTSSPVVIERMLGVLHPLEEPSGAPLPRIC